MFKKLIAWLFVIFSPVMIGLFPILFTITYFNLQDYCIQIVLTYTFIWLILFGCWFDESEYQNAL